MNIQTLRLQGSACAIYGSDAGRIRQPELPERAKRT